MGKLKPPRGSEWGKEDPSRVDIGQFVRTRLKNTNWDIERSIPELYAYAETLFDDWVSSHHLRFDKRISSSSWKWAWKNYIKNAALARHYKARGIEFSVDDSNHVEATSTTAEDHDDKGRVYMGGDNDTDTNVSSRNPQVGVIPGGAHNLTHVGKKPTDAGHAHTVEPPHPLPHDSIGAGRHEVAIEDPMPGLVLREPPPIPTWAQQMGIDISTWTSMYNHVLNQAQPLDQFGYDLPKPQLAVVQEYLKGFVPDDSDTTGTVDPLHADPSTLTEEQRNYYYNMLIDIMTRNKKKKKEIADMEDPTTQKPTTPEPTTQEPTTQEPTTQEPTTQEPTTQEPTTQEPTTQTPTTQPPTTQPPTTQTPTTQPPTTQTPTTQPPTTPTPTTQTPTTITPTNIGEEAAKANPKKEGESEASWLSRIAEWISSHIGPTPDPDPKDPYSPFYNQTEDNTTKTTGPSPAPQGAAIPMLTGLYDRMGGAYMSGKNYLSSGFMSQAERFQDDINDNLERDRSSLVALRPFLASAGTDMLAEQDSYESDKLKEANLLMGQRSVNWPNGNISNPLWVGNVVNEGIRYAPQLYDMPVRLKGGTLDVATLYGSYRKRPSPATVRESYSIPQYGSKRMRMR